MSEGDPTRWSDPAGPFTADQIHDGDPIELSNGHAIHCMSGGDRHASANLIGGGVLNSDPAVQSAGTDAGIAFNNDKNLRAPDVVVNVDLSKPGWIREVPPLVVEYADTGQNELELEKKIAELLELGTRFIWVVRLVGPLRVEIHEPGLPVRLVPGDGTLTAPGVLQNPVPVRALVDRDAALEATLRNLLARQGYASIDAIREEGREEGREATLAAIRVRLRAQLEARGWTVAPNLADRIAACTDLATLLRWLTESVTADSAEASLR